MSEQQFTLDEIEEMLEDLPTTPWHFDVVRDDGVAQVGALRADDGRNIVEPSTESMSMVIGLTQSVQFLAAAPQIVRQLLDAAKPQVRSPNEEIKPAKDAKGA